MSSTFLRLGLAAAAALSIAACGPSTTAQSPDSPGGGAEPGADVSGEGTDAASGESSESASSGDAPEISRSAGEEGGVVVFWPRVVPRTDDVAIRGIAGQLQKTVADLTAKALPDRKRDVRPEPERVCPQAGCKAMTVGVLLTPSGGGCAAMALVAGPGQAPTRIVPWVGLVELKSEQVPFRDPPENAVTIKDMVKCKNVLGKVSEKEADVIKAIKDAAQQ